MTDQKTDRWLWRLFIVLLVLGLFHTCVRVFAQLGALL